jgi:hypothetical protein
LARASLRMSWRSLKKSWPAIRKLRTEQGF